MSEYTEQFDGPPHPDALDPAAERVSGSLQRVVSRLEQELADTRALLRFQEMHKSANALADSKRMDWLLKESCIIVKGIYLTSRESIDAAIHDAEPANAELSDGGGS